MKESLQNPAILIPLLTLVIGIISLIIRVLFDRKQYEKNQYDIEKAKNEGVVIPKAATTNSYFKSRWWFISIITLVISTAVFFLLKIVNTPTAPPCPKKDRIVLLFPTDAEVRPVYEDGLRQLYGYAEYINKQPYQIDNFDFIPLSHDNSPLQARNLVEKELQKGTLYFISTMSKVNEKLSADWDDIIRESKIDTSNGKPILVCTVTSSPKVTLKQGSVYRFYIRSQEEAKVLSDKASGMGFKRAVYIVVDDEYGKGAAEEFNNNWELKVPVGIRVSKDDGVQEIEQKIRETILPLKPSEREVIFVAHYGNGIDNIFTALHNLGINKTIFATSTLSIPDWQYPIRNIIATMSWYTCIPDYKSFDDSRNDVIKNFTTYSINGLVTTIRKNKTYPGKTFDQNWQSSFVDLGFDVNWTPNGDAVIPLKVVDKDFFKANFQK